MHATCFIISDAKQENNSHVSGHLAPPLVLYLETRNQAGVIPSAPLAFRKQETLGVVKPIPTRASF